MGQHAQGRLDFVWICCGYHYHDGGATQAKVVTNCLAATHATGREYTQGLERTDSVT